MSVSATSVSVGAAVSTSVSGKKTSMSRCVSATDAFACTTDACSENNDTCTNTLQASKCLIANACYDNGATQPNNVCYRCASGSSTSAWSLNNGASCNDGNECTSGDTCAAGTCAGAPIVDTYESNNTYATAKSLGRELPADFNAMLEFTASLYGVGDEDWYTYRANDNGPTQVQPFPKVELQNIPANGNYQLCVWWDCDNPGDGEQVECQSGSAAASLDGHKGCCSLNGGSSAETVKIKAGCDNGGTFGTDSDVGTVIIRVYNATATWTCSDYKLRWGED